MFCLRFCSMTVAVLLFANAASSQDTTKVPEEEGVVRIDTELVDVPLSVRDKNGRPLTDLKRENFRIFEDGKSQEIAEFSTTTAPFEIAVLLDTSGSTRSDLDTIRRAAQHFIDSLRSGDRVAIVSFRSETEGNKSVAVSEIVSKLTDDRNDLREALTRVGTSNGTPYYDALIGVIEQVFREQANGEFRGRRALVALTDGVDSTSSSGFEEANELLEKSGIASYFIRVDTRPFFEDNLMGDCQTAIRFSSAQMKRYYASFDPNANIEKITDFCKLGEFERLAISKRLYEVADIEMRTMAVRSGGRIFEAAGLSEARTAFKHVAAEIGTRYSLGYYSSNDKKDGAYRRIRVEIKGLPVGATVLTRDGYRGPRN